MMNFLLKVYNSGVVDNVVSGSNTPDGNHGNEGYWMLLIVFVLGALAGYGIRCIVQAIKDAPRGEDKSKNSKSDE